jgi:rhamnosyltransferase
VLDNISSYEDQVDVVYAVDNSERPVDAFVAALGVRAKVKYIANGSNLGIATALNVGIDAALADGYSWVLTMDQDSTATPGMVGALLRCALNDESVALVAPVHQQVDGVPCDVAPGCVDVLTPMTSGNLLRTDAFLQVGRFMDDLFIDQVDSEFCLRLQRNDFRVIRAGDAELIHRVGEVKEHHFPFHAYSSNHSPLRRYYITRNRFVVGRMYADDFPQYRRAELAHVPKDILKILFWEDSKWVKLRMMWRGWRDYRVGRLGAYKG